MLPACLGLRLRLEGDDKILRTEASMSINQNKDENTSGELTGHDEQQMDGADDSREGDVITQLDEK